NLQFGIAVAVAPVATLVTALVLYVANNRSGKVTAEKIQADLEKQIGNVSNALAAEKKELRDDIANAEMRLVNDVTRTRTELSTRIDTSKVDLEKRIERAENNLRTGIRSDMEAALARLQLDVERRQQRGAAGGGSQGD
ncbi:MAG: hypothetical protein WB992_01885, partial [Bryobacteraceae bacterium]